MNTIVTLIDRQADLAFADKVWTIGGISRDADAAERHALLSFVNEHWSGK